MLLKRTFGWLWLPLSIITAGISNLFLAYKLHVYKKGAWYSHWYYWVLGIILIFPLLVMYFILLIQMTASICEKLDVPGKEIYFQPYSWILGFIIPFIGWAFFAVMFVYINIFYVIKLIQGNGEKYIK